MNNHKMMLKRCALVWVGTFVVFSTSSTSYAAIPTGDTVRVQLQNEVNLSENSNLSEQKRTKIVRNFIRKLKKLSDYGLGNPELLGEKSEVETQTMSNQFKQKLVGLVAEYRSHVKPILLENIKLKRKDDAAKYNKGELIQLSFPSRLNHKTGKPVIGLLHYKKDVSSSLFDSKAIDAGILKTFPSWEGEAWLQDALQMDVELAVLRQIHREYQDGTEFKTKVEKHKKSTVVVEHKVVKIMSEGKRSLKVTAFVRRVRKLDAEQNIQVFKGDLEAVVELYKHEIKSILVTNVDLHRSDAAARTNKGDLIALFFPHRSNHQTGKPITGKLRYKKDVSTSLFNSQIEEVGLLVEHPEFKDDKVIQAALIMEKELEILKQEHRDYLESDSMTFVH